MTRSYITFSVDWANGEAELTKDSARAVAEIMEADSILAADVFSDVSAIAQEIHSDAVHHMREHFGTLRKGALQ